MSATLAAAAPHPRAMPSPWPVAILVATATFMEVLDSTIANVALRYIAGTMAVSQDEAAWVVTTYLVANAIALTASAALPQLFGRKRFYMACIALFTAASILCGLAWDLESLLFFRVLQGLGGGGMVPVSQSILAGSFPPEKRGQAFAVFGIAVVVAPVVGPTLGGWLSDNLSWHWCFLINGPVGIVALVATWLIIPPDESAAERRARLRATGFRFDAIGFGLLALCLGSLELALDRGQQEDWFASGFIVAAVAVCAVSLLLVIPWTLRVRNPILDLRMVMMPQFGACFLVMGATGAILIATTQFLPELLQSLYGYTATWAGLVLSPGGIVTMLGFVVVGRLTARIQPKWLIVLGAGLSGLAMLDLTRIAPEADFAFFAWSRVLIGLALPLIFLPINVASYDGLAKAQLDQASALLNVARNVGGSIGVALAQNVLAHRAQFHQSRLAEAVVPAALPYQETLATATRHFGAAGSTGVDAQAQAFAWIGDQVQTQAQLLAYVDVFWTLMLVSLSAVPLALLLRRVGLGGRPAAGLH